MGYVTLLLHEAELIEGGMLVDQGTEQCRDREAMMPVTLHEEDLKRGTFVLALNCALGSSRGHFVPFTWNADGHSHQAVSLGGVYYGGTLEQFLYRSSRLAGKALANGWEPRVAEHKPRADFQ